MQITGEILAQKKGNLPLQFSTAILSDRDEQGRPPQK